MVKNLGILKYIALLGMLLVSGSQASATRTFYIDHDNGSNSNPGTKASPWKSHPFMQNVQSCTGQTTSTWNSYAHAAGDNFIFKGGVIWPGACFGLIVPSGKGGSSVSVFDYYGVDLTWFSGAGFTRPVFDMANATAVGGPMIKVTSSVWITFDNIEMKRLMLRQQNATCNEANMDLGGAGSGNITVKNMYIHDWTIAQIISGATTHSTSHNTGSICQNGATGGPINVDTVEMSDANPAPYSTSLGLKTDPFGACFRNMHEIKNSNCHHVAEGEVGLFGPIHDNQFHDINGTAILAYDNVSHSNVLETGGFAGEGPIYNNRIFDTTDGVTMFLCPGTHVFNNVMKNNSNGSIMYDTGSSCGFTTNSTVSDVFNNTVDCSNGNNCFKNFFRTTAQCAAGGCINAIFNVENNHWITNGTSMCFNTPTSCANVNPSSTFLNNITMPTVTAGAQGYIAGNNYAPTDISDSTVGAGTNLTPLCATLPSLCTDTELAPWFGATGVARPANTGTGTCRGTAGSVTPCWDSGAYMFPTGSSTPPTVAVTVPTNLATVSGSSQAVTATCSPVGPATISSIYIQIDGTQFGAAGSASPFSITPTWDTRTASNASHDIAGFCVDSNAFSNSSLISVTVSNSIPGCVVSSDDFSTNLAFTAQTGTFVHTLDFTPNAANVDDVIGWSNGVASAFSNLAAIIRFNGSGQIDVRNGGGYAADNVANYVSGTTYSFSVTINIPAHTYSVQMTAPSSVTLATNYAFRTEQSTVTSLDHVNTNGQATPNTGKLCNLTLASAAAPTFSPGAGTYSTTQSVALASTTPSSAICFTTDLSTPTANGAGTCTHGTTYSSPISVSSSQTVKAITTASGFTDSSVSAAVYVISAVILPLPGPVIISGNQCSPTLSSQNTGGITVR
jgi:hypothetical protein